MDKLDMESKNIVSSNIEKIKELFPNVITEDGEKEVINFDALKQELSEVIIDEKKEKYQLTWPGKKQAIVNANTPINKTLRPLKNKSVNFDSTQNIYIEGDNLDALKILQESYLNKIDVIYIDPPYNTGKDFIYNDNYFSDLNEELLSSGQIDEICNRLISNNQANGRFHSDWLSMMYSRIKLARNLLSSDGIIFISIDDNELYNLKKICDEIFGESCYLNTLIWKKNSTTIMLNKEGFSTCTEYVLVYKNKNIVTLNNDPISDKLVKSYNKDDKDGKGKYGTVHLYTNTNGNKETTLNMPDGTSFTAKWQVTQDTLNQYANEGLLIKTPSGWRKKIYLSNCKGSVPVTMLNEEIVGTTKTGTGEVNSLIGNSFSYPKPTTLIKYLLSKYPKKDATILDFFSGSATTADAVMQLNVEDEGSRKYIMIQLPDIIEETTETFKNGFKTICEIGEERIKRAGKKIKKETNANIDYGFRVYKVDESNMKDVFYRPNEVSQQNLFDYMSNVKEDRTPEDLLTQIILDLGLTLDLPIEEKTLGNNKVYYVADNSLVACFDDVIDINIIDTICECQPLKVVFKDSSFRTDKDKINLEERVKKISPETKINIL